MQNDKLIFACEYLTDSAIEYLFAGLEGLTHLPADKNLILSVSHFSARDLMALVVSDVRAKEKRITNCRCLRCVA